MVKKTRNAKSIIRKKYILKTDSLGIFKARVRKNSTKPRTWVSSIEIEGYSKEIVLILNGDSKGPFVDQIDAVSLIINKITELDQKILCKINDSDVLKKKFRKLVLTDLRLACLNPWGESNHSFELSYESKMDDLIGISVILESGEIVEIT